MDFNEFGSERNVPKRVPKGKPTKETLTKALHMVERKEILKRQLKKDYRLLIRNLKRLDKMDPTDHIARKALKSYFLGIHSKEAELKQMGHHVKYTLYGITYKYQKMLAEKLKLNESV